MTGRIPCFPDLDDGAGLHVDLGLAALDPQVPPHASLIPADRAAHVFPDGEDGAGGALLVVVAGREHHRVEDADRQEPRCPGHAGTL
ncbi:MAG: hypothetical protein R3A46_10795 [Thermomicrobiales bacterium]